MVDASMEHDTYLSQKTIQNIIPPSLNNAPATYKLRLIPE